MKTPWHNLAALAGLGLALVLAGGCKPKASRPGKDFSHADSVSVKLAKANWADGLRQVEPEKGLVTKAAKVGGSECRCLKTPENQEGFLYFIMDPTFKATNAQEVKVVVQYFDATEGSFTMEYDGQAGKYAKAESIVHQRASAQWETAEFILRNTRFDNLQDNNADFRLRIKVPEFFVRRVEVLRDTTPAITDHAVPESVTVLLQEPPVQEGLRLAQDADGKSTPAVIEGQACHRMDKTYMYFAIDPPFKWAPHMRVRVDVEVFDASPGLLEIQYDSWLDEGNSQGAYRRAPRAVQMQRQKQWRLESFVLPECRFENRQNGRSDFRLRLSEPEAYIRRVTVSRDASPESPPPTPPLLPPRRAGSNAVSIAFGKTSVSEGLAQVLEADSKTASTLVGGQDCLAVRPAGSGHECYIYFSVAPSFKPQEPANFVLEVEFFAGVTPRFKVQYNSLGEADSMGNAYRATHSQSGMTNVWTTARFPLPNALFKGKQNGHADFRLLIYTPSFCVRTVTLRHD